MGQILAVVFLRIQEVNSALKGLPLERWKIWLAGVWTSAKTGSRTGYWFEDQTLTSGSGHENKRALIARAGYKGLLCPRLTILVLQVTSGSRNGRDACSCWVSAFPEPHGLRSPKPTRARILTHRGHPSNVNPSVLFVPILACLLSV